MGSGDYLVPGVKLRKQQQQKLGHPFHHPVICHRQNLTPSCPPSPPCSPPPHPPSYPSVHECSCPLSTKFMRSWQNLMCFILQTSIVVHSLTTPITCQKSHNAPSYSLLILPSFIQQHLLFTPTLSASSFYCPFNPLRVGCFTALSRILNAG